MTTLYLIRHAEAEGNLYRRAHGHYDSLITENGYAQIQALAERFAPIEIDMVWSSDLYRTMTTARSIIEPKEKNLNTHPDLREMKMGEWEDKTWGQLLYEDEGRMIAFTASDPDWSVEGGESFSQLTQRMGQTVTALAQQYEGKTLAIFSHGLSIRQFLCYARGDSPENWGSSPHGDNTSVSKVLWDGEKFTIEYASDNSHLSQEISTFARQKWWKKDSQGEQEPNLWFKEIRNQEEEKAYQQGVLQVWGAEPPSNQYLRNIFLAFSQYDFVGWVSVTEEGEVILLHLCEGYRGGRLGLQLLGQAVSYGRSRGLRSLYLRPTPEMDMGFFQKMGFCRDHKDRLVKDISYEPRKDILAVKEEST